MFLWRISNYGTLDGRGGLLAPGRWHSQGHAIVYLAETPAGALTEVLVHLELDAAALPKSYKLLKCEIPDYLKIRIITKSDLPANFSTNVIATRTIGDEWLSSKKTALLKVPSVIVPETCNVLLNPEHKDTARVKVLWHEEYPWDSRLFQV
jgi:RES domain-containing protein